MAYRFIWLLIAVFALAQTLLVAATNDTDMLLHTTGHMLYDGGLYTRFLPVNLPLIYYIYALPVAASAGLHLPAAAMLHGFTGLCCAASLLLTKQSLHVLPEEERRRWLAAAGVALVPAPCIFHTFADREHWLFILAMPWVVQILLRLKPSKASVALAGAGCLIKPYNLVLIPALALSGGPGSSLRHRALSPSLMIATLMALGYAALICAIYPGYVRLVLPAALKVYSTIGYPFQDRLAEAAVYLPAALMLVSLAPHPLRTPFAAFSAGVAVIYCLNAGWIYTAYLLWVPPVLLCAGLYPSRKLVAVAVCAGILALATFNLGRDVYYTQRYGGPYAYNNFDPAVKAELRAAAGSDFILLSPHLWASAIGAVHGAPHSVYAYDDAPWPLPWISQNPKNASAPALWHDLMVQPLLRAVIENHSPVLIVDESPMPYPELLSLFKNDPEAKLALWGYEQTATIDHCHDAHDYDCRFSVWHRKANPPGAFPH